MADLPQNFSRTISGQEMGFTRRTQILEQVPSNQQQTVQPANLEQQVIKQLYDTVFKESAPSDLSKLHEIYADKIQNAIDNIQREADLRKAITDATRKEIEARNQSIKNIQEAARQQRRSQMGVFGKTKDSIEHTLGKIDNSKLGDITKKVTGNDKLMSVYSSFSKGDLKGVLDNTKNLIGIGSKLAQVGGGIIRVAKFVVDAFDNYADLAKKNMEVSSSQAFLNKGAAYRGVEQANINAAGRESSRKYTGTVDAYQAVQANLSKEFSKTYLDELNRGTHGFSTSDLVDNLLAVGQMAEQKGVRAEQAQSLMSNIQRTYGLDSNMSASATEKFYRNIEKKFDRLPTGKVAEELTQLWESTKHYGVGLDSVIDATSKYSKELTLGIMKWQDFGSANKAQESFGIKDLFTQISVLIQAGMFADIGKKLGKEYENLSAGQIEAKILAGDAKLRNYKAEKALEYTDKKSAGGGPGSLILKEALGNISGAGLTKQQIGIAVDRNISLKDTGALLKEGSDASAGKDLYGEARKQALKDLEKAKDTTAKVVSEMVGPTKKFSNALSSATSRLKDFSGALAGALKEEVQKGVKQAAKDQMDFYNPNK